MSTKTAKKTPAKKAPAKKAVSKRSGNPAKRAEAAAAVSSASDFKSRIKGRPLPLPSGLMVMARRVELRAFLKQGNIPNPLMELVQESLEKGSSAEIEKMVADEDVDMDMVNEMYEMVESIVISSVVSPSIHPDPEDEDDKDDNIVYISDVEEEDKMFIYQWACGGTDDIATFREEARADMATLAEKQGSAPKTK